MNYEQEFNVTAKEVKREVDKIKIEKREYDETGELINREGVQSGGKMIK